MALTKADISDYLCDTVHLNKGDAKQLVEIYFVEICSALQSAQQVKLSGFGNFELHDKKERPGRNPKTGESIPVSARRVVTFRSGQKLRARVEAFAENTEKNTEE